MPQSSTRGPMGEKRMNEFSVLARRAAVGAMMVAMFGSFAGCTRIETGSVGVTKSRLSGEISKEPAEGLTWTVLKEVVADPDTTETRIALNNLQPSDSTGSRLDDMDVILSITLNTPKVPEFYIKTKEFDSYKDEAGKEVRTVGLHVVQNIGRHAVQEVTKLNSMSKLASTMTDYEKAIKDQAQKELDAGYPGVFNVVRANVNNFKPPESVSRQANAMANLSLESERLDKEMQLTNQREKMAEQAALIDARALRKAADDTHLTAEQLTAWRNAKSYAEQAAAMGQKASPVVDPGKQPAPR